MKKLEIKGAIISNDDKMVYDWFGYESTSPKDVLTFLSDAKGQEIEIDINSGGGDIFAGSEIRTAIKSYAGNKLINIVGLAGSAASVIATACKCLIAPTGLFMIHNVSSSSGGDYHDMDHMSEVLKVANQSVANAYKEKTGLSDKELLAIMDKETWMSSEEAVEKKFVDGIMFQSQLANRQKLVFNNGFNLIPQETIEKIRDTIKKPIKTNDDKNLIMQAQKATAQLNLLKLKGELK